MTDGELEATRLLRKFRRKGSYDAKVEQDICGWLAKYAAEAPPRGKDKRPCCGEPYGELHKPDCRFKVGTSGVGLTLVKG